MARGQLTIFNRTSGEVMLYFVDAASGKSKKVLVPPNCKKLDLLKFAPMPCWNKSPNLVKVYDKGDIGVVL